MISTRTTHGRHAGPGRGWRRNRFLTFFSTAAVITALVGITPVGMVAGAAEPVPGEPVSGDGVIPLEYDGNTSCQALEYPFGFKIEGNGASVYTGTFPFDLSNGGSHTGGAPDDPDSSVTLSSDGYSLDWTSTLGLDAVIMKGGQDSNAYVYFPEDTGDTGLASPVMDNGNLPAISHVEFCYDYDLTATKTADAEYTAEYTWTIDKSVDPASHTGFAGESFTSDYDVTVDRTVVESGFAVSGTITVGNPSPLPVTFSVTDSVGGTPAAVTCPSNTIPARGSVDCTYTAALGAKVDGTNTATVTTVTPGFDRHAVTTEASYAFGAPTTTVGYPTIDVADSVQGSLGSASGDYTFEYDDDVVCPTDQALYTDGYYAFDVPNTATITETGQSDDARVTVECYLLSASKTAQGTYDETHTWTVEKSVAPESQSGVAGDELDWQWTVDVSEQTSEGNFAVTGTITVQNPNPGQPANVLVEDVLDDGTVATLDCDASLEGAQAYLEIPAGGSGSCGYTAAPEGRSATLNTVTVSQGEMTYTAESAVSFTKNVIGGTATVTDGEIGLTEQLVAGDGPWQLTGADSHTCSSDIDDYGADGAYTGSVTNVATVTDSAGIIDSDDAATGYTCYAPLVTKDASATYDEVHRWSVEKSVDPLSQRGYPGDVLDWTWTVNASETSSDEDFAVTGTISVTNPSPDEAMTVALADVLDDGTVATLDCGGALVVPAGGTATCGYTAAPSGRSATLNSATATLNEIPFSATADVSFVKTVVGGSASLADTQIGLDELLTAGAGPWEFSESYSHTCLSAATDYGADGTYSDTKYNTATLVDSAGTELSDSAQTSYTCEAGLMNLVKTTNRGVDPTRTWSFALYEGPDGFGSSPLGTATTLGDADGVLDFGGVALRPDTVYTVCELQATAGWTSFWQVDVDGDGTADGTAIPYNPDGDSVPPEDLGNRCVDFGGTGEQVTIPLTVGTTVHFSVDNSYPGGDPRTPGYWKNWNRCTGGGQQYTADANGGWAEGFWLLEDVLDPDIGGGVVWGTFQIQTCPLAVSILSARDAVSGKNMNADPGYTLAKHLLAAELNLGAGACAPTGDVHAGMTITEVTQAAEALLAKYGYDGAGTGIPKKGADATLALQLAKVLDGYNNGMYCGSTMP